MKKGKVAKQAQDAFSMLRESSQGEKVAIENLNKSEMVAILIGDSKVNMPGLQAVQKRQKNVSSSKKGKSDKKAK
jgi:hypothetical protein